MSVEENKSLVRRAFDGLNGHKLDNLDTFVHGDIMNHTAVPAKQRGIENFKAVMNWLLTTVPDQHWSIEDMISEEDKVVCRITWSGTHQGEFMGIAPTGKRFSVEHIHIFRITDGKLSEHWAVRDDLNMIRQLGFVPSPE